MTTPWEETWGDDVSCWISIARGPATPEELADEAKIVAAMQEVIAGASRPEPRRRRWIRPTAAALTLAAAALVAGIATVVVRPVEHRPAAEPPPVDTVRGAVGAEGPRNETLSVEPEQPSTETRASSATTATSTTSTTAPSGSGGPPAAADDQAHPGPPEGRGASGQGGAPPREPPGQSGQNHGNASSNGAAHRR
ncbi:MAG TPA: hypothetical protein VGJ86_14075 [Acidimicrobiales bacterium]|jgi:hypothetical protein